MQKYVVIALGHELNLSLECKTICNSVLEMLIRFVCLRSCILKAMIDVKYPVQLSDADFENVKEIVSVLESVKLAVEALCRRDIDLVTADAAVKFAVVSWKNNIQN